MASNLEPKINRIATAVTSALSALTAKGVTVPAGANVESLAALIESIEAGVGGGGSNLDWRGFPILTGTFTPSSDISSNYMIEYPEGERLHYKTVAGSQLKWKPMFLLFPDIQFKASKSTGYIQNIGTFPNTEAINVSPNNTGTIFAYTDGTSVNTTYVKGVYDVSIGQSGIVSANDYQEVTILSIKIPCTSSLKLMAGLTYRWMLFASIYAEEVTIV